MKPARLFAVASLGLRSGRTRVYLVNGFVYGASLNTPAAEQESPISEGTRSYILNVEAAPSGG